MTSKFRAAILCGGSGTRLWPLSRDNAPKQFHPLVSDQSLLSETVHRAVSILGAGVPMILTAEAFGDVARDHAQKGGAAEVEIILEPSARNTAPAAALAALAAAEDDPSTVIGLFPSDHHIADERRFLEAVENARALADEGYIVTLGIVPEAAHTGYGYVRRGDALGPGFRVDRFIEKPDAPTAAGLFADKRHYWNAGIFFFRADVFMRELDAFRPDIMAAASEAWRAAKRSSSGVVVDAGLWAKCPAESIDYAVAEKTHRAAVVPADMGWNDVGSWASLSDLAASDGAGNALSGDVRVAGSSNCYVRATTRHVSVIGASDLIVVETGDAVLIVHKDATQDVKGAAEAFRRNRIAQAVQ